MEIIAVQLDLNAQKESMEFLKRFADFSVKSGYNTVVLYLEGAVRTSVNSFFDVDSTYSLDEISELVEYMESKGLDVIPAFENAGHMRKWFLYPQFGEYAELQDAPTQGRIWSGGKHGMCGCVTNEKLTKLMDTYVKEVCSVFHSKYVHMGMDEIFEFAECERCKKALAGGKTKADLFYELIVRNYRLVTSLGREMMMWDDFFQYYDVVERLPRDIILCHWNYNYITDEPKGQWTNRIKRDWLRIYEEHGFRYLFCTIGQSSSPVYNIDTLTAYAEKFEPLGALMTTWERSDRFYPGMYPGIAYAAAKWNGRIETEEDVIALYAELLGGDRECAELVLSVGSPNFTLAYTDIFKMIECGYHVSYAYGRQLAYVVKRLKKYVETFEGEAKKIVTDIYVFLLDQYLHLQLAQVGTEIFNGYEQGGFKDKTRYDSELAEIERKFVEIKKHTETLWEADRKGIKNYNDECNVRYSGNIELVRGFRKQLAETDGKDVGVLYLDCMLGDTFASFRGELRVKYADEEEEVSVYDGGLKTSLTVFDCSGTYGFRFAIENKPVEYAVLSVYGEGSFNAVHCRYLANGKKRSVKAVEAMCGYVKDEENILFPDVRFASVGYEMGIDHLNDIRLCRQRSEVKMIF